MALLKRINSVFIIAGVAFCATSCGRNSTGTVEVLNKSENIIMGGAIKVCGEDFYIPMVKQQESIKFQFAICADSDYLVKLEISNGQKIQKRLGYITTGIKHLKDLIVFKKSDIFLERKELETGYF